MAYILQYVDPNGYCTYLTNTNVSTHVDYMVIVLLVLWFLSVRSTLCFSEQLFANRVRCAFDLMVFLFYRFNVFGGGVISVADISVMTFSSASGCVADDDATSSGFLGISGNNGVSASAERSRLQ